jgi:hypothetical protein
VFCSTAGKVPATTAYGFGSWPQEGCQAQESCWLVDFGSYISRKQADLWISPSQLPIVRTHVYNQGSTLFFECQGPNANESDGSRTVYTELFDLSIYLSLYTFTSLPPKTSPIPANIASIMAPTSSSATAQSTNTEPTTSKSDTSTSTTSTSATNTPDSSPPVHNSGWSSPGAVAGYTIAGGAIAALGAFFAWRQWRYTRKAYKGTRNRYELNRL